MPSSRRGLGAFESARTGPWTSCLSAMRRSSLDKGLTWPSCWLACRTSLAPRPFASRQPRPRPTPSSRRPAWPPPRPYFWASRYPPSSRRPSWCHSTPSSMQDPWTWACPPRSLPSSIWASRPMRRLSLTWACPMQPSLTQASHRMSPSQESSAGRGPTTRSVNIFGTVHSTNPVLQADSRLGPLELFRGLAVLELLLLRQMPLAVRNDLAGMRFVIFIPL